MHAKRGYLLLHEIGHRPFGLADEYDNPSIIISSHPYQNVFDNKQQCEDVLNNLPLRELQVNAECRKIHLQIGANEYYTFDTTPNDLMVDNKQFQELDTRRIEKWFEGCLMPDDNNPPPPEHCKDGE